MTEQEANFVKDETQVVDTINPNPAPAEAVIDYKNKFSESSKEALRLLDVQKEKEAEIERLTLENEELTKGYGSNQFEPNIDNPFEGFDDLDENAREQFVKYTNGVVSKATQEINKDPAIAFARKQYNTQKWDNAFNKAVQKYPKLAETRDDFRTKYFDVNNVPENVDNIMLDIAKIHLFDSSMEIGAQTALEKESRIELERNTAGPKETSSKRSLEDWMMMQRESPEQFRKLSKEFNDDMISGKI